jgi:hypothetical protein
VLTMRMVRDFKAAVADWDEVCSALGAWECEHLTKDVLGVEKQLHHRCVTELLRCGLLLKEATDEPFRDKAVVARVNARIRHLEDKLALWHREMASEEQDRIVNAAFG